MDRRTWFQLLSVLSAARVAPAQQPAPPQPPQRVNREQAQAALKLIGLEFNDAQVDMMLRGLNRALTGYEDLRKVDVPLDTEPAIVDAGELDRLAAETSPDIIPLVIEQFASEAAVRLKEVLEATAANDVDALRKAAHALAGASASVGGIRLRARAKEIEQEMADSSVWLRKDGEWLCVMHTETELDEGAKKKPAATKAAKARH